MKRREFIAGLGSAAAWSVVARGQQGAVPVIGFVSTGSAEAVADFTSSFRKGLSEIARARAYRLNMVGRITSLND
jgi:putative tryptophan/tyrosine transport system substrate-binding protein